MGIKVGKPELDLPTLLKFKDQAVDGNTKGVAFLFKKNKIDAYQGTGRVLGAGKVEVKGNDGKTEVLETKNIVIATGSDVAKLKGIEIDEKRVVSSTGALDAGEGAGQAADRRRRHHRARARFGLAPARRADHRGRIPRPHSAGHGRRGGAAVPAHAGKAGHDLQARLEGDQRRYVRQDAEGQRRARGGRRGRDARSRCRARVDRPRALHRRPRA